MNKNEPARVDADAIIARALHGKRLPGPIVRLVRKILHQDDFNAYFEQTTELGIPFSEGFLRYLDVELEVIGAENIPAQGRFTFASNHPLGMLDAIAEMSYLGRRYDGQLVIPANDLMMMFKQVQEYFIPVNKIGAQARELGNRLDEAFAGTRQMLIFPAGVCSRKIDGRIQDYPWKKTFISKSRQTQRDIIPVWFSGRNSNHFYRIDRLRNLLHLKLNLAMFTLADELFKCRGKRFRMVIGKPIPWQSLTRERKDAEWASFVREQVYALGAEQSDIQ